MVSLRSRVCWVGGFCSKVSIFMALGKPSSYMVSSFIFWMFFLKRDYFFIYFFNIKLILILTNISL